MPLLPRRCHPSGHVARPVRAHSLPPPCPPPPRAGTQAGGLAGARGQGGLHLGSGTRCPLASASSVGWLHRTSSGKKRCGDSNVVFISQNNGNKSKNNKWDLLNLKSFCTEKETINKTKRQHTDWEKILANDVTEKGLVSKIYKQLMILNSIKTKQSTQKTGRRPEETFL